MNLPKAVGWAKGHRNVLVVVGLILVFAGADLLLNRPKGFGIQWFSVPLLAGGFSLLALIFWPTAKPGPRSPGDTLADRFLWRLTFRGRLVRLFPLFGIVVIVADLAFNLFVSATPDLLTHDQVVLLFGAALIAYPYVPDRYGRERDFVFLFVFSLASILVLPIAILRLAVADPSVSVDAYSAFALAPQTSAILNGIGVGNSIVYSPLYDAPGLAFRTASGQYVEVYITSACSGIYSFAIFSSAFIAYVLTEQRKLTRRVLVFFALGIFLAYFANVLRMVIIVWIGYRYDDQGVQNLLFAHSNVGWIIFLAWVALFWILLFRFLPPEVPELKAEAPGRAPRRRGVFCGICGIVLTPAIPATRCTCGRMYHAECLAGEGRCPNCSAPSSPYPVVDHPVA